MEKKRVLVTFVEAGMGHIVSAQAISEALAKKYADKLIVEERFVLRDSENPVLQKFEKYLVRQVKLYSTIPMYGDIEINSMHLLGAQNTLRLVHATVFRAQRDATIAEYVKLKPDVILCTHYFLLHCAVEYKLRWDPSVLVLAYDPDNNVHGWWDTRADALYTNNPFATAEAFELKFGSGQVVEAFYPTRSCVVDSNESMEFYREKFGIPADKFAVVVADGVYAKAKVKKVCTELLKSDVPMTVCVLAGKNEKLKAEFDEMKPRVKPNITLLTFGFTPDAPQLYKACNLFITKAGPNAVLDSVMMGTPVVIDYCASPIERATRKLFTERFDCGYFLEDARKIRKLTERLALDPSLLAGVRRNLAYFDKNKNGAEEIADDIEALLFDGEHRRERLRARDEGIVSDYHSARAERVLARAEEQLKKAPEGGVRAHAIARDCVRKLVRIEKKKERTVKKIRSGEGSRELGKAVGSFAAAKDFSEGAGPAPPAAPQDPAGATRSPLPSSENQSKNKTI